MKAKIGLVTLGDPREEVFKPEVAEFVREERDRVVRIGERVLGIEFLYDKHTIARFSDDIPPVVNMLRSKGAEAVVFFFPIWGPSHLVAMATMELRIPVAILTNRRLDSGGLVALTLSGGALDQVGYPHKRLWGDIEDEGIQASLRSFLKAASTAKNLRGKVFGAIGGRTLGMYTATADPSQWQKLFGIDVQHMDQMNIISEAAKIPGDVVEHHYRWLVGGVKAVDRDGHFLTDDKLRLQIRCYLATKKLQEEAGFDFIGIKCIPEMSDNHVSQCLTAAFMNDPYDADGPKESVVCACEVDMDAALTMQVLKMISGGRPSFLMDVRHIDDRTQTFVFNNCGGAPTWFAGQNDIDPYDNLAKVVLKPQKTQGKAGGAATHYACQAGPATFARFCRYDGQYKLLTFEGHFVTPDGSIKDSGFLHATTDIWPHAYATMPISPEEFIEIYGANHIHAVTGHWNAELKELCRILGITYMAY